MLCLTGVMERPCAVARGEDINKLELFGFRSLNGNLNGLLGSGGGFASITPYAARRFRKLNGHYLTVPEARSKMVINQWLRSKAGPFSHLWLLRVG
jgi:hypothetical protein